MVSEKIRAMGAPHWLLLFGVIGAAWGLLYAMALPSDLRAAGQVYGLDFLTQLCVVTPDAAGLLRVTLMWCLMSAAMMTPTVLPALATYDDLAQTVPGTNFTLLVQAICWSGWGFPFLQRCCKWGFLTPTLSACLATVVRQPCPACY